MFMQIFIGNACSMVANPVKCHIDRCNYFSHVLKSMSIMPVCRSAMSANIFWLWVIGDLEAKNCEPVLNLNRSRMLQFLRSVRQTQKPCNKPLIQTYYQFVFSFTFEDKLIFQPVYILVLNLLNYINATFKVTQVSFQFSNHNSFVQIGLVKERD